MIEEKKVSVRFLDYGNTATEPIGMSNFEFNILPLGAIHKGYPIFWAIFWPTYLPISDFVLL